MKLDNQFFKKQHNRLLNFIRNRVNNDDIAQDILQEVFLKIHLRINTLGDAKKLQSWIYQITRNTIIDHYRMNRTTESLKENIQTPEFNNENGTFTDIVSWLESLIKQLPDLYKDVLLLSEIKGLKQKNIATELGHSLSTIKSRIQRGRVKLKKLLIDCCQFEFDYRGKPIDYQPKEKQRNPCCP